MKYESTLTHKDVFVFRSSSTKVYIIAYKLSEVLLEMVGIVKGKQ